jgi:hypothetical protein
MQCLQNIDWGDVPTWIGAIGTVLAVLAAIYAGVQAKRVYLIERRRDHQAEDDRRRTQAVAISGWVTESTGHSAASEWPILAIMNASTLPVYDLVATVTRSDGTRLTSEKFPSVAPAQSPLQRPLVLQESAIGAEPLLISLTFLDASGLIWCRDSRGKISELAGPPTDATVGR